MASRIGIVRREELHGNGAALVAWARSVEGRLGRRGVQTRHNSNIPCGYYLTPEETEAIVNYCRTACSSHPEKGCRTLCWEMADKNIACVGESGVYNVINRYKLAKQWEEIAETGRRRFRPAQGRPRAVAHRFLVHQDPKLVLFR